MIKDGKILCAERGDRKGICGPGGHLEEGETYEEGAIREAMEEFGIKPRYIIPFEFMNDYRISKCPTMVYLTDEFDGEIQTDDEEMFNPGWLSAEEIVNYKGTVFPAFMKSVTDLVDGLKRLLTRSSAKATIDSDPISEDGGSGSGNHGHGGRPGKVGGSSSGKRLVDYVAAKKYTKDLKGVVTSKGVAITKVSGHAAYRMKERNYSSSKVEEALTKAEITYTGNKANSECYQHGSTRLVVSDTGVIISVIDLEEN